MHALKIPIEYIDKSSYRCLDLNNSRDSQTLRKRGTESNGSYKTKTVGAGGCCLAKRDGTIGRL